MSQPSTPQLRAARRLANVARRLPAALFFLLLCGAHASAQGNFVSGSTGADGAFNPTESRTVQLPESGVLNYTTINIPANVTIRFTRNSRNTPVTILATGSVTIAGTFDISGSAATSSMGGIGGPGGFNGGAGGTPTSIVNNSFPFSPGVNGDGPGGGRGGGSAASPNSIGAGGGGGFGNPGLPGTFNGENVVNGAGGPRYGLPTLLPLIGGSGGGGEVGNSGPGRGGGGGGGALLLASSGTINFVDDGGVNVRVAAGGGNGGVFFAGAGGGSGGAVRLVANAITGNFRVYAGGGPSDFRGGMGGGGYVRIEAFDLASLTITPTSGTSPRITTATPGVVVPPSLPSIRIVSVAGIAPPAQPNGSLQGGPDVILPADQSNPVSVALAASNIPLGTTLQVTVTPETGERASVQSTALAGTLASSTATASVSLPDGISVIQASGTIDVAATGQSLTFNGERVKRIEVGATYGGGSVVTYVTESNKRIRAAQ